MLCSQDKVQNHGGITPPALGRDTDTSATSGWGQLVEALDCCLWNPGVGVVLSLPSPDVFCLGLWIWLAQPRTCAHVLCAKEYHILSNGTVLQFLQEDISSDTQGEWGFYKHKKQGQRLGRYIKHYNAENSKNDWCLLALSSLAHHHQGSFLNSLY